MIILSVILGILVYVFFVKVFDNLVFDKNDIKNKGTNCGKIKNRMLNCYVFSDMPERVLFSLFFPISIVGTLLVFICFNVIELPLKLADIVCDPKNYKFKIKIEKK